MKQKNYNEQDDFDVLRELLVGPELEKIRKLSQHLENEEQFSTDISDVLPRAMNKSAQQGDQLSQAMVPTVEEIVRLSIKRDINKFADALFPVIGPAIRKAISETIRQKLESLNRSLERGLSWQGLKWRLESIRTGIPFAEIVLLKSLVYRVEQVFLIHRESSLLLNHIEIEDDSESQADMVSSMLAAIGDFVGDSFKLKESQTLDSIQVGDFSILVEQGPDAILAVAVRGNAPESIRTTLQQVLETIQRDYHQQLKAFKSDTTPFEACHDLLNECMASQYIQPRKKAPVKMILFGLLIVAVVVYWLGTSFYQSSIEDEYIAKLEQEPGFVVTQIDRSASGLMLKGLRDPLARDPAVLITESRLKPEQVMQSFQPYQSLDSVFIKRRLLKVMDIPAEVELEVSGQQLNVSGFASPQWLESLQQKVSLLAGIERLDTRDLITEIDVSFLQAPETVTIDMDVINRVMTLTGSADLSWLENTRKKVAENPEIQLLQDELLKLSVDPALFDAPESVRLELVDSVLVVKGEADQNWINSLPEKLALYSAIARTDLTQLVNTTQQTLLQDIEFLKKRMIFFDESHSFNFEEVQTLDQITLLVQRIINNARALSLPIKITVKGNSDSVGDFQDNVFLSIERADYVAQYLFNSGISPKYILIKGMEVPVAKESSLEERRFNRRVTFEVTLG